MLYFYFINIPCVTRLHKIKIIAVGLLFSIDRLLGKAKFNKEIAFIQIQDWEDLLSTQNIQTVLPREFKFRFGITPARRLKVFEFM